MGTDREIKQTKILAKRILSLGYDVYMIPDQTWLYYTDGGSKIASCEYNGVGGTTFSRPHKPKKALGSSFGIDDPDGYKPEFIEKDQLERAFLVPSWALHCRVESYKDINELLGSIWRGEDYQKITLEDLK